MAKKLQDTSKNDPVTKRLDAIIRLLMENQINSKLSRGDQLLFLDSIGLSKTDIGRIVGLSSKDISSWLIRLKKSKRKRKVKVVGQ